MTEKKPSRIAKISYVAKGGQGGFKIEGDESWFNPANEEAKGFVHAELVGKEVEIFTETEGSTDFISVVCLDTPPAEVKSAGPKPIPPKPKSMQQKIDEVKFETLLDKAHEKGLKAIRTSLLHFDAEKMIAVFKAEVIDSEDNIFVGHGDVIDNNIDQEKIKKHWIRMAETRAIVRALKLMTNNAECSEEEKA